MFSTFLLLSASLGIAGHRPPGLQLERARPLSVDAHLDLDPTKDTFTGHVEIDVFFDDPSRDLWLHARELDISQARLWLDGEARPVTVKRVEDEQLRLTWSGKATGEARLEIDYTGAVSDEAPTGLFHRGDGSHDYLFTQFEATDARSVFPSFDQPNHKVPWQISVTVPEGSRAYSNAPLRSVEGGRHDFAPTRPLPSYLIAIAVGPFAEVDAGVAGKDNVPIRLLVPPGREGDAAWAVSETAPLLNWMESWFGIPYPYEKLDVVAIPDLIGFTAMEHPGLITFDERFVVADAASDTVSRRRSYVAVQAHELAHQWFGNLVTPAWWEDLWLNEGFASWMGTKAVAALYPSWNVPFKQVASRERAMAADALTSARRIREPIVTTSDIDMAFDSITYSKGQAVLEMFETWLGPATFQSGVRAYIAAHAHGVATTDDFLAALTEAAGKPVDAAFSTFLDQPGVPLVEMRLECAGSAQLVLHQRRYLPADPSAEGLWQLPVCVRTPASGGPLCTLMDTEDTTLPLPDPRCPDWVIPAAGAAGYYRSAIGAEQTTALLASSALSPTERVGMVGDAAALVASGALPPSTVLSQVPALVALGQPPVTRTTLGLVRDLDDHLVPDDLRPAYARFIRVTYGPLADALGFDPIDGEPEEDALLRPEVLSLVGNQGEDAVLRREAARRVDAALRGEGSAPEALGVVLSLAALEGGAPLLDRYRRTLEETDDEQARRRILSAMTAFSDPEAVDVLVELAMDDTLTLAERGTLMFGLFSNRQTQPAAWARMQADLDQIEQLVPAPFRRYITLLAAPLCTPAGRAEAEALLAPRAKRWLGGSKTLAQTLESIDICVATTAQQQPGVAAFLSAQGE